MELTHPGSSGGRHHPSIRRDFRFADRLAARPPLSGGKDDESDLGDSQAPWPKVDPRSENAYPAKHEHAGRDHERQTPAHRSIFGRYVLTITHAVVVPRTVLDRNT